MEGQLERRKEMREERKDGRAKQEKGMEHSSVVEYMANMPEALG
jgi:hypothetical protein